MKILLPILLMTIPSAWASEDLWKQVQNSRRDGPIADVSAKTQHDARIFFRELVQEVTKGSVSLRLRQQAVSIGLHIRVEDDRVLLWGREAAHGLFVFRLGAARDLVLQAPHAFYDLGSGLIQSRLFDQFPVRAAFFNSAHRYGGPGIAKEDRQKPTPDLAHRAHSLFQAATIGTAEAMDNPLIVQIHGFRSRNGESAVLSSGPALQPNQIFQGLQHRLNLILSDHGPVVSAAARPELAALSNVQGRILSSTSAFLHLELSKPARDDLLADNALLNKLGESLLAVRP